jgi:hypothetical protein
MAYNGRVRSGPRPLRIAVSGKMRSGKDTAAERLVGRHGFVRLAFADRLKELASEMFELGPGKNRDILVRLGSAMCAIDQLVWVRHVLRVLPDDVDVVIPDLRFGYELAELRRHGFRLVRVDISPQEQLRRIQATDPGMDLGLLRDISETALDKWRGWDFRLSGLGTMERFNDAVDRMVEAFRGGRI